MADLPSSIPLYDIRSNTRCVADEYARILNRIITSGRFVAGPELAAFEQELGCYLGASHVLGVKSGTDALVLTLDALGIGPGDEVITTPFTFFATVEAIIRVGATPVFADIESGTLCLDPAACESTITPRTKAVLLVHLFGHCGEVSEFVELCAKHGLALIEDASQAIGSIWQGRKLGSFGNAGTFSFYPTKNLAALGDGGAVATSDPALARTVGQLRRHGRDEQGQHIRTGYNSQLDEIQAAVLRLGLARLDAENTRRRVLAARYDEALAGVARLVRGHRDCVSNYHQYAILVPERDKLRDYLSKHGVETGCYYERPVYLEPALERHALPEANCQVPETGISAICNLQSGLYHRQPCPVAEQTSLEIINLPIRPTLTEAEQERIILLIQRFYGTYD